MQGLVKLPPDGFYFECPAFFFQNIHFPSSWHVVRILCLIVPGPLVTRINVQKTPFFWQRHRIHGTGEPGLRYGGKSFPRSGKGALRRPPQPERGERSADFFSFSSVHRITLLAFPRETASSAASRAAAASRSSGGRNLTLPERFLSIAYDPTPCL